MAIVDWTIGAGGDFATFALHRSSELGSADTQRLTILNTIVFTAEVRYFSNDFPSGVIIRTQPGREFKGDFNSTETDYIDGSGLPSGADVFQFAGSLTFENIGVIGSATRRPVTVDGGATLTVNKSGILTRSGQALLGGGNTTIAATDSVLVSEDSYAVYDPAATTSISLNNCIIVGNNATYGALRERFSSGNFSVSNSVFINTANSKGLTNGTGNLSGTNNVTKDASANDVTGSSGNLINQPVDTWFDDVVGNDYRINSTGQSVLTGAGSGGVNIGGDFYLAPAGISIELSDVSVNTYIDPVAIQRFTSVSLSNISTPTQIDELNLQRFTSLTASDISIITEIDDLNINRFTSIDLNSILIQVTCDQLLLQRFTSLSLDDVSVSVYVDILIIENGIILDLKDIKAQTEVDSISISRSTSVSVSDITVDTFVDDLNISRYTNLEFNGVALNTYVDNLTLITGFMPDFGPSDLRLINKTINYKLNDNTARYKVTIK